MRPEGHVLGKSEKAELERLGLLQWNFIDARGRSGLSELHRAAGFLNEAFAPVLGPNAQPLPEHLRTLL